MAYDSQRRDELLAEARRQRMAWVEEARYIVMASEGEEGTAVAAEEGGETALQQAFPGAVTLVDILSRVVGDMQDGEARLGGQKAAIRATLSSLLRPYRIADVDLSDDQPIPGYAPPPPFQGGGGRGGEAHPPRPLSTVSSAHAYGIFLDKLKHPLGADVVKTLQQFITSFKNSAGQGAELKSAAAMGGMLQAFLRRVEMSMRDSALWSNETEQQWADTLESLERFVVHKVYDRAFALSADDRKDQALHNRLHSLSFLTFEHLDIASIAKARDGGAEVDWSAAEAELHRMCEMRCPGDKLASVLRCTKLMTALLMACADKGSGGMPGADEFLPALILVVKRSNPSRLFSNLMFVQDFRDPSKLTTGEAGYAFTQLMSAVHFLEEADSSALTISAEDFERGLQQSRQNARKGLHAHQELVAKAEARQQALHEQSAAAAGPISGLQDERNSHLDLSGKDSGCKRVEQRSQPTPLWPPGGVAAAAAAKSLTAREVSSLRRRPFVR